MLYSDVLSSEEFETEKKRRKELLEEYEAGTKANKEVLLANKAPYSSICAIDRMIKIIEMEKETLKNL